jgi:hypothetical protein
MPIEIIGRNIGPGLGRLYSMGLSGLGVEIFYAFIIIACSLMIYFSTREIYQLTRHKGVKYFRLSFLFFAIAYFSRSFIKLAFFFFDKRELRDILPIFGNITLFIFSYFSVMAIFFLLYSVLYKKWGARGGYVFNLAAIFLAGIITLLGRSGNLYFVFNLLLFIFIGYATYVAYNCSSKKRPFNYVVYLLLFIFWMLNILDILVPDFLQAFQFFIYLASAGIFLLILYKVLRKTG